MRSDPIRIIDTPEAPTPRGHYSQAIVAQGMLYLSGQLPITPGAVRQTPDGIEAQTRLVLANMKAILESAGASPRDIVSLQAFITDSAYWPVVNAEFAAFFGEHRPARTIVPVAGLAQGALIEVNAVALAC